MASDKISEPSPCSWWQRLFTAGAVVIVVMAVRAAAGAQSFLTGNRLYDYCESKNDAAKTRFCLGFVAGIAETIGEVNRVNGSGVCIPLGATAEQTMNVTRRYLEAHPADLHEGATTLVANALLKAFPCR